MPPTMFSTALTALFMLFFILRFEEFIIVPPIRAVALPTAIAMPTPLAMFELFFVIFNPSITFGFAFIMARPTRCIYAIFLNICFLKFAMRDRVYYNNQVYLNRNGVNLKWQSFVKLVIKNPKYKGNYSFKTWLYTIGRNEAINYLKHRKRFSDKPVEDFENLLRDEENLEKLYFVEERKIAVHSSLQKLNGDYRQVLYLTVFEELTNEEAARVMKKNKRQIENLVYRAKKALKAELEKEGFVYEEL